MVFGSAFGEATGWCLDRHSGWCLGWHLGGDWVRVWVGVWGGDWVVFGSAFGWRLVGVWVVGFRSSGCDLFRWDCGGWVTMKAIAWFRGMEVGNSVVVKSKLKVCLSAKHRAHSPWGFFPLKRGTLTKVRL